MTEEEKQKIQERINELKVEITGLKTRYALLTTEREQVNEQHGLVSARIDELTQLLGETEP